MYGFTKGEIPYPYERLSWQMRLERDIFDYDAPSSPYSVPGYVFSDLERDADYMLAQEVW